MRLVSPRKENLEMWVAAGARSTQEEETLTIQEMSERDIVIQDDHVRGAADAPVTLIEYGEFECPDCGRSYHLVKRLLAEAPDEFRFVFRHFARDDVHPFSERSAEAAEAAGAQGRFWEMHDFSSSTSMSSSTKT
jgi:protein-disulfide isomerase